MSLYVCKGKLGEGTLSDIPKDELECVFGEGS